MVFVHWNVCLCAPFDSEAIGKAWYGVSITFRNEEATLRALYHAHVVSSCVVFFHSVGSKASGFEGLGMDVFFDRNGSSTHDVHTHGFC